MTRYLLHQTFASLIKLFVFITFMFFFIQIMMPGDFVDQFSLFCDAECQETMRAQLGLDLPIWQRYLQWLKQVVTLDLGESMYGQPIVDTLKDVIPPTLLVFVTGTAAAFMIGLWLGKRTAWRGPGLVSGTATLGGIALFTSFPPWLAWLVTYAFARGAGFVVMGEVGGLRGVHFQGLTRELWMETDISPAAITFQIMLSLFASIIIFSVLKVLIERVSKRVIPGILVLILIAAGSVGGWYYLGIEELAIDIVKLAWLPTLIFTLLSFGETMIIMQSSMTDVLKEEYVITAKAKGLPTSTIREKHAARNAILPVMSRLVISLPYLITGVVIVESSVGWPGMGTSMWNALYWQNMPLVMDILLIVGVVALVARLILDILTAYLDPRIRYSTPQPTVNS